MLPSFRRAILLVVLAPPACVLSPDARDAGDDFPLERPDVGVVSEGAAAEGSEDATGDVVGDATSDAAGDVTEDPAGAAPRNAPGALSERVREERREAFNPYVITAHRHNYLLPLAWTSSLNEAVYREGDVPLRDGLVPLEVKFQISLKTRLNERDLYRLRPLPATTRYRRRADEPVLTMEPSP